MPVQEWPEHTIELGRLMLTPPTGPSVGTARHRQTAMYLHVCRLKEVIGAAGVTPYMSSPSVRLNVVHRIYKGSMGNHQNGGRPDMVSRAPRSLF